MTLPSFTCNVAYNVSVNEGLAADDPNALSYADLWEGVRRGCTHPHEFAPYVASCDVTSGDTHNFIRELTLADGAVHTASGEKLVQKVVIAEGLAVSFHRLQRPLVLRFLRTGRSYDGGHWGQIHMDGVEGCIQRSERG